MASGKQARHDIVNLVVGLALPNVSVHDEPPSQLTSPSVVVVPATPYREPSVMCGMATNLELIFTVPRAVGGAGLDELDDLIESVLPALTSAGWLNVISVDTIGIGASVGATEHLSARVRVRVEGER